MVDVLLQPSTKDSLITSNFPDRNYGAATFIYAGENKDAVDIFRTLIKFDLASLPSNAVVSSAVLSLLIFDDLASEGDTYRVYRLLKEWNEGVRTGQPAQNFDVTWNNRKTSTPWTASGAFDEADCEQSDIGNLAYSAAETGWLAFTLNNAKVTQWISGVLTDNGMLIKSDNESNDCYGFHSRSYATEAERPKLAITYELSVESPFGPVVQVI